MKTEKIFLEYSRLFHQDCELYGPTWEDIIATSLSIFGKEKSKELNIYLNSILYNNIDDDDLVKMWDNSRASIYLGDKTVYRPFLQAICDMAAADAQSPD
jgi:hypothetical protein